ncbi:MAG: hypothetical protein R3C13_05065 [Hyphomonas sp.]|uniref:hypothetical protein n=1 Tax=Hyphomonas sp. TaxID=87 RepID=UPI00352980F8
MSKFEVKRKTDAWYCEIAVVEATTPEEALEQAAENEGQYRWQHDGVQTFDDRHFVLLDRDGVEI